MQNARLNGSGHTFKELPGTQVIRLIDVFLLAPVMIKAAGSKGLKPLERNFLYAAGIGTALFNGINYLRHNEQMKNAEV
jgi:hypothetical protein